MIVSIVLRWCPVAEAVQADCSTALARWWQNSGHRTGNCVACSYTGWHHLRCQCAQTVFNGNLNCVLPARCIFAVCQWLHYCGLCRYLAISQSTWLVRQQTDDKTPNSIKHCSSLLHQQRLQNPNSLLNTWITTCTIPWMAFRRAAYWKLSPAPRTSTLYPTHTHTHTTITLHLPAQPLPSIISRVEASISNM